MLYKVGKRHLAILQYKFIVEWADGSEVHVLSLLSSFILFQFILFAYYSHQCLRCSVGDPMGHSAIMCTININLMCDVVAQFVLSRVLHTPGVWVPYTKEILFRSCWRRRGL